MNIRQIILLIAAIGLLPIAFSYGLMPQVSLNYLFGISVSEINEIHIFRAVMGLYVAFSLFWFAGALKIHIRQAALYSLVVFMLGLAAGRSLSMVIDGVPHWLLVVYLALEFGIGILGILMLKKSD